MSKTISLSAEGSFCYDITIEKGILNHIGEKVRPLTSANRVAIITDSNVAPLYLKKVVDSFKSAGFQTCSFAFEAGESSKTLETVSKMLEFFCINKLTRRDIAVALGGGVTGDLVGFASAIYLRGIDFVQIPTTLLAQVDSSVGGKTGCDLPFGKNLCGAFHNPIGVFIDTETLKTLPEKYLRDGFSEAIKSGAILNRELFELFEKETPLSIDLEKVVILSVEVKSGVVARDFKEKGERALLNFGHTIGHAIEGYQAFTGITHGAAVAVGMAIITTAFEKAGLTKSGTADRLIRCLKKHSLDTNTDIPLKELISFCQNDKKSLGDKIRLVYLREIGVANLKELSWDKLLPLLESGVL